MKQKQKQVQNKIWLDETYEDYAEQLFIEMSDGAKLRVLHTTADTSKPPLVFIPGLGSIVPGWDRVLLPLKDKYTIYYFESREKKSSIVRKSKFTWERFALDLKELEEHLDLKKQAYITVSSSLGATSILDALSLQYISPKLSLIAGPNPTFPVPKLVKFLIPAIPSASVALLKPVIRWYIHRFMVDLKNEPEQAIKYDRVLHEMEGWKIKAVAMAFRNHVLWEALPNIQAPCVLVGASKDKMHKTENTRKISELIPHALFVDLRSNKEVHDKPMVDLIEKAYKAIETTDPLQTLNDLLNIP